MSPGFPRGHGLQGARAGPMVSRQKLTVSRPARPWLCAQGACPAVQLGAEGARPAVQPGAQGARSAVCSRQQGAPSSPPRSPGLFRPSAPSTMAPIASRSQKRRALQQAKQHSYPDQSQHRLSLKLRGPSTAESARCRLPEARLPAVCGQLALIFSFRPPSPESGVIAQSSNSACSATPAWPTKVSS